MIKLFLLFIAVPFIVVGQNTNELHLVGEEYARQEVKTVTTALSKKTCFDRLINDKELAERFAEIILFNIYGKENIISERPYNIYLIDGYWYISGTLPEKYMLGGTFEIIFNSIDGQILKLCHGK